MTWDARPTGRNGQSASFDALEGTIVQRDSSGRRRWTLRLQDAAGAEAWLVITVPPGSGGLIHASVGTSTVRFTPEDIPRVRQAYLEALSVALQDRGEW
jgi:hypothetical protein